MDELGPGAALLLMGLVVAILMGCDAAVGRAIVANWGTGTAAGAADGPH